MATSPPRPTADGHHVEIDGRRWRATDPSIPDALESELVHELMDARRAVKDAAGEEPATTGARSRVQDAKVALGERGPKWWTDLSDDQLGERLAAAMRALLHHRAEDSTICPSDAARVAGGDGWRDHMDLARSTAFALQDCGQIEVRNHGKRVESMDEVSGTLRLARGPEFPS